MFNKGDILGERYKLISILGEGGMANVYLADDIILGRKVAVKVLRLDKQKDPKTIQRFQREALATSELSHKHIVSIFDVGSDKNCHYIVMEYVDGLDLKEYIKENKPIAYKKVIEIMDQILSAMALAHKHNVIHRDLKPQNILMDKNSNIKIVDFGIATALNHSTLTQTNTAMGSVHYMSPEQARGSVSTKQSDIYSLGIILYELLIGDVPFDGENAVTIALKHFQEKTPSLRKKDNYIPQPLENVVFKATAKDPRDRYKTILEIKEDLDTSLDSKRANEPVFVPKYNPETDKTIVIPKIASSVQDSQKAEVNKQAKDKRATLWENIKKHKWWWIGSGLAFIIIMLILIFSLSRSNDVVVPDTTNDTELEARQAIVAAGLRVGKISHESSNSVKKNRVIKTLPNIGSTIKNGNSVDIVLSSGRGLTSVPDVTEESYSAAYRKLTKLGFKVNRKNNYSNLIPKNIVISQSIDPEETVKPDKTTITLYVSKGPKKIQDNLKLKDLTGYSLKGAQDYARDNGLTLQVSEDYSDTAEKGTVIKQNPSAGSLFNRGDMLSLVVSKGKKEDSSQDDKSVTKSFTIPYESPVEQTGVQGNHIQIYVSDANHSISNIYQDQYINSNKTVTIPFDLSKGNGHIIILRDGKTILDEDITN